MMAMRALAPALLLLALCACAGGGYRGVAWDGRRGYDGNGDYGYDLGASRAAAAGYRAHASRSYPAPGSADDPWGPYIREAAQRHGVPERWIREVMRQESGGRLYGPDGSLVTSRAGAMGLMQVMPRTYDMLRRRYGLGDDPYHPRDNILAGAAYIREMHDRFGSPTFLAAYNAGPDRVDAYLAGATVLPDETVDYVARIAPRLGGEAAAAVASAGPAYGRRAAAVREASYAGSSYRTAAYDPALDRAFDGGGLVTRLTPTGDRTGLGAAVGEWSTLPATEAAYSPAPTSLVASERPPPAGFAGGGWAGGTPWPSPAPRAAAAGGRSGPWAIQVGAYPDPAASRAALAAARSRAPGLLADATPTVTPVSRDRMLYRARLVGLSAEVATDACATLSRGGLPCFAVPPGS
jgi:D-alanyl-D-alanine carboxypeptidase